MILFASDWSKYPTAFPDQQTSNKSFVRLASLYREMGIQNHAFVLALVNPILQGVDPFDPNLTLEQMFAIGLECKINPWYFFREVVRVPPLSGNASVPLEANRGNIALFWSFFNHITILLIQIRQTGKSVSTDVLMNLLMNVMCQNTDINLLTKDDILRRKNVERIKEIANELPRYLQQKTREDANNGEEITIKSLNNTYTTHVPQSSPKRAYNMGRGLTSPIFHVDEAPFQPNIAIALPAALAATGAAIDSAKRTGSPYGTILTTTVGKKDDKDGKFVFKLASDAAIWTEKFFDAKTAEELEMMVRRNSRAGKFMINATFNHQQLGKTDEWLKQKLEESMQEGGDADRDFFNLWTSGSQTSPLPVNVLEMIANSVMEVQYTEISNPHAYIIRWYVPEAEIAYRMKNSKVVMGMDTSEASGGDDISLIFLDVETAEVLAAGTFNETNLITFSEWVASLLVTYPNLTAIIERRSTGAMVLDYLLLHLPALGIDPFARLFNRVVNDADEMPERYSEIKTPMGRRPSDIYVRYKKTFGFATSGSGITSRSEIYSTTLQNAAKRAGDRMHDKSLIDQTVGLVIRNGRVDHEEGEHDDLTIGWMLAHWLLTLGKNLAFYGIDPRRVYAGLVSKNLSQETPQQQRQREEQQRLRQRIEQIYEELSNENDEFISMRLEQELRILDRRIVLEQGEIYSVDELIRQATESKRQRRRLAQDPRAYQHPYGQSQHQLHYQHGRLSDRPLSASELYR